MQENSVMSNFNEIIQSETPTLVDFFATWCGPCKMMAPILDEVKNELGDKVRILKIDVDKNPIVADQFKIRGVPTFILFRKGEILWRKSGGMDRRSMIRAIEEQHI